MVNHIMNQFSADSPTRILVVDDHAVFREFLCSTLRREPDLRIVGQAEDGLEAVQQAEALNPDLVLLDIGLPKLNGIEVAREIVKLGLAAKIVFVSQESSSDIVHAVLSLGPFGYVLKARAGNDLLPAIRAAAQGQRFVSSGLMGKPVWKPRPVFIN